MLLIWGYCFTGFALLAILRPSKTLATVSSLDFEKGRVKAQITKPFYTKPCSADKI